MIYLTIPPVALLFFFLLNGIVKPAGQDLAENLADCYSKILGIPTPRVRLMKIKGAKGAAPSAHVILVDPDEINQEVVSHEIRHTAQYLSGHRFDFRLPYYQRWHERDAFAWSDANMHRCPVNASPPPKAGGSCIPHDVVKGDTWYGLARRYQKTTKWANSQGALIAGKKVCV